MVLANGSMSSAHSGEDVIRRAMVEADVVDCMVALPRQLFYSTQIPACLWFLARNKNPGGKLRDRRSEVLFIDARKLGTLVDRTRKEFSENDIAKITRTYHAWREGKAFADAPGLLQNGDAGGDHRSRSSTGCIGRAPAQTSGGTSSACCGNMAIRPTFRRLQFRTSCSKRRRGPNSHRSKASTTSRRSGAQIGQLRAHSSTRAGALPQCMRRSLDPEIERLKAMQRTRPERGATVN
jgi:N-6 DNA Methylase